jgi:osmotically inducible protein OsmC
MKLSFVLGAAGFTPSRIETTCTVTLENGTITTVIGSKSKGAEMRAKNFPSTLKKLKQLAR